MRKDSFKQIWKNEIWCFKHLCFNNLWKKRYIYQAILAGLLIGIGGCSYLSISNPIIGSIFFSLGLLVILVFGWSLYTGHIHRIKVKCYDMFNHITMFLFNGIGAFLMALIVINQASESFNANALALVNNKMDFFVSHHWIQTIFAGALCGCLMFIAVTSYKETKLDFLKPIIAILCVATFILCGFEHSIADIFYFSCVYNTLTLEHLKFILTVALGNSIGSIAMYKLCQKAEERLF